MFWFWLLEGDGFAGLGHVGARGEDRGEVAREDLGVVRLVDLGAIVLEPLAAKKKQDLRQKHAGKKLNRSDSSLEI